MERFKLCHWQTEVISGQIKLAVSIRYRDLLELISDHIKQIFMRVVASLFLLRVRPQAQYVLF
jgi:hypothetical protein